MDVFKFALLAALIESVVTTIKWAVEGGFKEWPRIVALVLGVIVTPLSGLDLFANAGIPLGLPYIGSVLTGLIVSRGANVITDFAKLVFSLKENVKTMTLENAVKVIQGK